MRTGVVARDPVALAAAEAMISSGTAVDAALAGLLAGATRGSAAALLGSAAVLVAGPGAGAYCVDGRARAPGLNERRPRTPEVPPRSATAAVPMLLEAVLAAHARFGEAPLSEVVRAALSALKDSKPDTGTRARMKLVEQVHRRGISSLDRAGVRRGIMGAVGPIAGGCFTEDDLKITAAPVRAVVPCVEGEHGVLCAPRWVSRVRRYGVHAPEAPVAVPVESVVTADRHGVMAAVCWAVPETAVEVDGVEHLGLASLLPAPRKGVARWRPGAPVAMALPLAVLLHSTRAWAAVGISGEGDLTALRDRVVNARYETAGVPLSVGETVSEADGARAVACWVVRELDGGGEVCGSLTAV